MKKLQLLVLSIFFALPFSSCDQNNVEIKNSDKIIEKENELAGTWKLIEYKDFDSASGKWISPYGEHPKGYFTYTKNGIVNLSISSEFPLIISEDSIYNRHFTFGELLDKYTVTYFGKYTIDYENSIVTHLPEGGSIPWYIGTEQPRQFILKNDSLFIGDPTFEIGKRVLVREQ